MRNPLYKFLFAIMFISFLLNFQIAYSSEQKKEEKRVEEVKEKKQDSEKKAQEKSKKKKSWFKKYVKLKYGWGTRIKGHRLGSTLDIGLRKSYINIQFDFEKKTRPINLYKKSEFYVYKKIIIGSFIPSYILLEANEYPFVHFLSYLKGKHQTFYRYFHFNYDSHDSRWDKMDDYNVLRILSGGGEKPYSFYIFLGDILPFFRKDESDNNNNDNNSRPKQAGYSLAGFVGGYSNKRLRQIMCKSDHWYELLYKVKGTQFTPEDERNWRFESGILMHSNEEFIDTFSVILMRRHLDKKKIRFFSPTRNIKYEFMWQPAIKDYRTWKNIASLIGLSITKYFTKWHFYIVLGVKYERFRDLNDDGSLDRFDSVLSAYVAPSVIF